MQAARRTRIALAPSCLGANACTRHSCGGVKQCTHCHAASWMRACRTRGRALIHLSFGWMLERHAGLVPAVSQIGSRCASKAHSEKKHQCQHPTPSSQNLRQPAALAGAQRPAGLVKSEAFLDGCMQQLCRGGSIVGLTKKHGCPVSYRPML